MAGDFMQINQTQECAWADVIRLPPLPFRHSNSTASRVRYTYFITEDYSFWYPHTACNNTYTLDTPGTTAMFSAA
jgi:hypothetical protein